MSNFTSAKPIKAIKVHILDALDLLDDYTVCRKCGNDKICAGSGTLTVKNDSFERTCSCGWRVKINWLERGEQV